MIASPSRQKVLSLRYVNNSLSQIKDTNAIILFILRMYTDINNIIHLFFFSRTLISVSRKIHNGTRWYFSHDTFQVRNLAYYFKVGLIPVVLTTQYLISLINQHLMFTMQTFIWLMSNANASFQQSIKYSLKVNLYHNSVLILKEEKKNNLLALI